MYDRHINRPEIPPVTVIRLFKGSQCFVWSAGDHFAWQPEDLKEMDALNLILAADVVYDNDLTEAFMRCIQRFLQPKPGFAFASLNGTFCISV